MADLTVKLCREIDYSSPIWPDLSLEEWQKRDMPTVENLLREYTIDLLNHRTRPADHTAMIEKGEAYIGKLPWKGLIYLTARCARDAEDAEVIIFLNRTKLRPEQYMMLFIPKE